MEKSSVLHLNYKKCEKCGAFQLVSHIRCIKCKNIKFITVKIEAKGKILTYTELYVLPTNVIGKKSIVFVIVEMEYGIKILGQYQKNKEEELKLGRTVTGIDGIISLDENGIEKRGLIFIDD